jgi:hypothetical protein
MIFVGERKLFEKSFSFPHTPYLSKTLQRDKGFILNLIVRRLFVQIL